jgi:hypothetical protein
MASALAAGGGLSLLQRVCGKDKSPSGAIDLGSRRELFVDDFLIDRLSGTGELRLHSPDRREVVMVHDRPWEGSGCGYHTVFRDGDVCRMYYVGGQLTNEDGSNLVNGPFYACYAESKDGLHWHRPELGLVEAAGSRKNNVIWSAPGFDNVAVFKDPNPVCRHGEEYKAVSSGKGGLYALRSSDGTHWAYLADQPIITKGRFDSQNLAFWDPIRKHYWCYLRNFHNGMRDIRVATSSDFRTWTEPVMLRYVDSPDEQLYTNQVAPYYRAPHLFVGFPTRYVERAWSPGVAALPDRKHREARMKFSSRYGTAVTEGLFMTSRDGRTFRRWGEAFIRPGIERQHNWLYGDGYQNWGLLETASADPGAPPELSLYVTEDGWKRPTRLRHYTMRIDGFVSLHAPLKGAEAVTRPFRFTGNQLSLNLSTSAAGSLRVELQDAAAQAIPGHALGDCDEIFGDSLDKRVTWHGQPDLGRLAGKPIRLRLVLRDADLYSLQFV